MKPTPANIKALSLLGQKGSAFNYGLLEAAQEHPELCVLTADLALLTGLDRFRRKFPDRFIQCGIAEQNMMGIAAGLAMEGAMPVATTYCSFIAVRALEQIRQNISSTHANVKIVGTFAGVVAAKSGISHWATEDIAFMRALPGMTVLSPCDALEAVKAFKAMCDIDGPVYLRLSGSVSCPVVNHDDFEFKPGALRKIRDGDGIAIIATGLMVKEALDAADALEGKGIGAAVYDAATIKPIDRAALDEIFKSCWLVATVEEHTVIGGLGSAVAEAMAPMRNAPALVMIGFEDCYTRPGSQRYIWDLAGLTAERIAARLEDEARRAGI